MKTLTITALALGLGLLVIVPLAAETDSRSVAEAAAAQPEASPEALSAEAPTLPSFEAPLAFEASLSRRTCLEGDPNYCETVADCPAECGAGCLCWGTCCLYSAD